MNYAEFLKSKTISAPSSGFDVALEDINDNLKPHQKIAVQWAVKGGRRALFEAFGLGKTAQQLEYCRIVIEHTGGRALIVLPLGVKQEFTEDAVNLLGIVERIIRRYSNEGELVYDPFGGLMTVPMTAVKMHRRGYGAELNPDYFRDGVGYLKAAEEDLDTPTLFDMLDEEGAT